MILKKEDIYIDLKGKSKDELTELYDFLNINNEPIFRTKERFLEYNDYYLSFSNEWLQMFIIDNETEVTIEQLKEIIKPDLQAQLENAKKEVERIEKLIEEENEPKIGDWCKLWEDDKSNACIGKLRYINHDGQYKYQTSETMFLHCEKITNPELIKLLEDESK